MRSNFSARPAWVEINLDYIAQNVSRFRHLIGPMTQIMAVVKADGYGHGAVAVAETALKSGASSLAVAFVEEAISLRKAGIDVPILLLGYTDPVHFSSLIEYKLIPTVFGFEAAINFSRKAQEHNVKIPLHIKIDTGMGRIGLLPEEAVEVISRITLLPGLLTEGVFTHFAAAEEKDEAYTSGQLKLFNRVLERCHEKGITFPLVHAANSAASINHPSARYNLIRLGLSMYGYYPSTELEKKGLQLFPALTFKSRVVLVKKVPPGTAISYGCTYHTTGETLIATIPVGYADGYSRLQSNRGQILIRGQRAPVVGNVCMDHFMADVTHIPGVRFNDEVVLYGRQGNELVSIEEAAEKIGTINYELLCAVNKRVPRFYFKEGKLISIHDFIEDYII